MLNARIVEVFKAASDETKARMLGSMPMELLVVGSEVYIHLGESNQVWFVYILRVGAKGLKALSKGIRQARVLPLLREDSKHEIIAICLEAGLFVDEVVSFLPAHIEGERDQFDLESYVTMLKNMGEKALPAILKLLSNPDPYTAQYAFNAFDLDEWHSPEAVHQLASAVYALLAGTQDGFVEGFIRERCAEVLAITSPDLLLQFVIGLMNSEQGERFEHPVTKASGSVIKAYKVANSENQQAFVLASLKFKAMPWAQFERLAALVILSNLSYETLKEAFCGTSYYVRQEFGEALRFADNRDSNTLLVMKNIKSLIYELLEGGYPAQQLLGFLQQAHSMFSDADFVNFITLIQAQRVNVDELVRYFSYERSTPFEVAEYLGRLSGVAQTDAAVVILSKLCAINDGFAIHRSAFAAAMTVIVAAYTKPFPAIRMESYEIVQRVPFKYLERYLTPILKEGKPKVAMRFATFVVKKSRSPELVALATDTLTSLMESGDPEVQRYLFHFFNSAGETE